MFLHFGLNTFAGLEWSDGTLDPAIFDPTDLDAGQWVDTAVELGAAYVVLTAKHHDGFCLWPTATTDYSVASSPWRGGHGDVVAEVADACRRRGIGFGVYLSPWDRHAPGYQDAAAYVTDRMALNQYVTGSDQLAENVYAPPECDVSIRRGWFWHPDDAPKSVAHLMAIHLQSVGLGANLLLNLPPDISGRIDAADVDRVREFRAELDRRFARAAHATLVQQEPGCWIATLPESTEVGQIELREAVENGQRITRHAVVDDGRELVAGGTVGIRRIHQVASATLSSFEIRTDEDAELNAVIVYPADATLITPELPDGYEASTEPPE